MVLAVGVFVLSAAVIVFAGTRLSRYGDRIADLTGLGGVWIGVVLMALATSLPEILTDVSAALMNAPDIAAGDLFGSNMANMLILGIVDLMHRQKRLLQRAAFEHAVTAGLAMLLTGLAAFFVLFGNDNREGAGLEPLVLMVTYLLGMRLVYRQESLKSRQREQEKVAEALAEDSLRHRRNREGLRAAGIGFGLSALAVAMAAPFLAGSATEIAEHSGITATFVGTSLVGITTSLPELVTTIAAVRLGAFDLAVGNLFGSNAFNMAAFIIVDLAFWEGPLFQVVSDTHAMTAVWANLLMSIALMGLMYRVEKRYLLIEPDSLVIILGYALGLWLLFP